MRVARLLERPSYYDNYKNRFRWWIVPVVMTYCSHSPVGNVVNINTADSSSWGFSRAANSTSQNQPGTSQQRSHVEATDSYGADSHALRHAKQRCGLGNHQEPTGIRQWVYLWRSGFFVMWANITGHLQRSCRDWNRYWTLFATMLWNKHDDPQGSANFV